MLNTSLCSMHAVRYNKSLLATRTLAANKTIQKNGFPYLRNATKNNPRHMVPKFKRILLKLSGESLMGNKNFGFDNDVIAQYAADIKLLTEIGCRSSDCNWRR